MAMTDAVDDAVKNGELELGEATITATIPGPDGKPVDLVLWEPTVEQIAWIASFLGKKGASVGEQVKGMNDLMEDLLEPDEFEAIWRRLRDRRDPLKLEHVTDAISLALEAVQDFPTEPSSGSARSSGGAGKRSTGRAPGAGSTRSSSRRVS